MSVVVGVLLALPSMIHSKPSEAQCSDMSISKGDSRSVWNTQRAPGKHSQCILGGWVGRGGPLEASILELCSARLLLPVYLLAFNNSDSQDSKLL